MEIVIFMNCNDFGRFFMIFEYFTLVFNNQTNLAKTLKNLEKWQFKKLFLGTCLFIYHCLSIMIHIYHQYSKTQWYSEKKIERNYEKKHKVCKKQQKLWIYLNKKWPPTLFMIHIFHLSSLLNLYAAKKYIILSYWI